MMLRDQGDNAINDSVSPHCVPRSHECDILFSFHRGIPSSRGTQMKYETGEREISLLGEAFLRRAFYDVFSRGCPFYVPRARDTLSNVSGAFLLNVRASKGNSSILVID